MAQLPHLGNFDRRVVVHPRGVVKVNAMLDTRELHLNETRIKNRPNDVLFNGSALRGEFANEASKAYDWEPAAIVKESAMHGGSRGLMSTGSRNANNQDYRVPIVSNVTGAAGLTPFEIASKYSIIGICEQTGRRSGSDGLNVILSGLITLTNSGDETIHAGDYVRAAVPTKEEAARIHAVSGNMANTLGPGGRVPFITLPVRPGEINYRHRDVMAKAIDRLYEEVADGERNIYVARPVQSGNNNLSFGSFHVDPVVKGIVDSYATTIAFMLLGARDIPEADAKAAALDAAVRFVLASGSPEFQRDPNVKQARKALVKEDQVNKLLNHMDVFRFALGDTIIGRAVHTIPPRRDGDVLIGKLNN